MLLYVILGKDSTATTIKNNKSDNNLLKTVN